MGRIVRRIACLEKNGKKKKYAEMMEKMGLKKWSLLQSQVLGGRGCVSEREGEREGESGEAATKGARNRAAINM